LFYLISFGQIHLTEYFQVSKIYSMKQLAISLLALLSVAGLNAQDLHHPSDVNKDITPYHDSRDAAINTAAMHAQPAWKQFSQHYPSWGAAFNRYTKLPHRAFGNPITFAAGGADPIAKAKAFLQQEFTGFNLPLNELVMTRNFNDGKYINVDFKQIHNNTEVLWSRVSVRFTQDLRIAMVGIDAHKNIPNLNATIAPAIAIQNAEQAIATQVINSTIGNDLKIFPLPVDGKYEYHLVYAVTINTQDDKIQPGEYLTYVDANDGKILYRQNKVLNFTGKVKANLFPTNLYSANQNLGLPNAKVTVGATTYYTDNNGNFTFPGAGPVNATISLDGKFCNIVTGTTGTTSPVFNYPVFNTNDSVTLNSGSIDSTIRLYTCFYHINIVHDFMKSKFPSFNKLDSAWSASQSSPLLARVDRSDGTCNAFYNGPSVNFYTTAGGCNALSEVSDVMYHEYGHAITNRFWDWQGLSFDNGAVGEGYSDIWACAITHSPLIGPGFYIGQPNSTIRRYDINPKVYPQDLVGQVHADGEIIAGAWWDTGLNWGSVDSMADLFAATHFGLANGPDGTEGQVYHDILIDALLYDDDNANLNDGTPHFNYIVPAFAAHGIYLLSNTVVNHAPSATIAAGAPFTISADAMADFPAFLGNINMIYRKKGTTVSDTILMTKIGTNYTCQFPVSSAGDVFEYIFAVYDYTNALSLFSPMNAQFNTGFTNRNIPYYLLVGYNSYFNEPFTNITSTTTGWTIGNAPGDNATSGKWIVAIPVSSVTNGDTVQTGKDHTTGTGKCAVTGNAASTASQPGNSDVDNGKTTLITETYDLSQYNQPVISYWRWFTNSQSSSDPGKDLWRVWISYDNGGSWTVAEKTYKPDVRWRRNVIIPDLTKGTTAKLMFTAMDSVYTGVSGTWIEAAVDDIEILALGSTTGIQDVNSLQASIYPNPASNEITVVTPENGQMNYSILNTVGQTILSSEKRTVTGNSLKINTSALANGIYFVKLEMNAKRTIHRLVIAK